MTAVDLDLPEETYRASPGLSYSGAKLLLPPNCPAIYKWRVDNPQEHKAAFDLGHAVHAAVLGVGAETSVIDADGWTTKAARQARDEAYDAGLVPLLRKEAEQVEQMRAAVMAHPIAGALFEPGTGAPEVSLKWEDRTHGITKRARLDWLQTPTVGRAVAVDLKTCISADPAAISKAVASYGYDMQAWHYSDGVQATHDVEDVTFLFVFVEKTAPHLVTVCELDSEALLRGEQRMRWASEVYAECQRTDIWPGYADGVEVIGLPSWAAYEITSEMVA